MKPLQESHMPRSATAPARLFAAAGLAAIALATNTTSLMAHPGHEHRADQNPITHAGWSPLAYVAVAGLVAFAVWRWRRSRRAGDKG